MTQERVTIDQLERAEAAVRTEQHYGRNTWPCEMDYADCRGCDAHTAVDGGGYCIHCASDLEALHSMEMIEWEGFERIIWAGLLASVLLIGAAIVGTKLAGWW